MNNPNCGACGMLSHTGFCKLTACIYPCKTGFGGYINKQKTNADKIRSMTDEELAEYLSWVALEGMNGAVNSKGVWTKHELAGGVIVPWLDWLKQEVYNV